MLSDVFASLGRFVYRRRVPVVLAWVLVLGIGLGVGGQVFGRLGTGSGLRDDAESVVVSDLLREVAGEGPGLTGLVDGRQADDPAFRDEVAGAVEDLEAVPGVRQVTGPWVWGRPQPGLVARDGEAVLVRVELETGLDGPGYDRAVALGLQRTGRIVTSAAALIVVVFLGFGRGAADHHRGRAWHGDRGRALRHRGQDAAGPGHHEADGPLELVGAAGPATAPRPLRRGRDGAARASPGRRAGAGRLDPCRSLTRDATVPSSWW